MFIGYPPLILDVRPELARGQEPFATIMQTIGMLQARQELLLIAPFEPIPLYAALGQKGFTHQTEHSTPDEWRITFRQSPDDPSGRPAPHQANATPTAHGGVSDRAAALSVAGGQPGADGGAQPALGLPWRSYRTIAAGAHGHWAGRLVGADRHRRVVQADTHVRADSPSPGTPRLGVVGFPQRWTSWTGAEPGAGRA